MLDEFLNGNIYIKVTAEDLPLMEDLQNVLQLKFNSGNNLYGEYMQSKLEEHSTIYLYTWRNGKKNVVLFSSFPKPESVNVNEIINDRKIIIDEDEWINLVTENE